jgi:hypothetical protein
MSSRDAIEEIRAMLDLVRSVEAQRLRSAIGDSFADDVAQKMAINRAVFAAGYGIDPRPYAAAPQAAAATASASTETAAAASPATAAKSSLWRDLAPFLIGASLLGGGAGLPALYQWFTQPAAATPAAAESATAQPRFSFGLLPPLEQ